MKSIILVFLLNLSTSLFASKPILDLNLVHPRLQKKIKTILLLAKKQHLHIGICETLRTVERQAKLVKLGYSQTMYSYHILGLATDFCILDVNAKCDWKAKRTKWEHLAKIIESVGLESGYRWKTLVDGPHAQLVIKGFTSEQLHVKLKELGGLDKFYRWIDQQK